MLDEELVSEQVFDFEEPFDRRQQEGYQPHCGKDLFQNVDSHGQQSYGHDRDYRPPSRDSPRQTGRGVGIGSSCTGKTSSLYSCLCE
jgi:hypothetical protein